MKKVLFILSLLSLSLNAKLAYADFLGMFDLGYDHASRPGEVTEDVNKRIKNLAVGLGEHREGIRAKNKEKAKKMGQYHKNLKYSLDNNGIMAQRRNAISSKAKQQGSSIRSSRDEIREKNKEVTGEKIENHTTYMTENAAELEMRREE